MSSKLSYVLDIKMSDVIKNFSKLDEKISSVLSKLGAPVKLDVDAAEAEKGIEDAKGSVDSLEDKSVSITADGEDAISESEETKSEIEKVPDNKHTRFTGDNSNMLTSILGVGVALQGFSVIYNKISSKISEFITLSNTQETAENSLTSALKVKGEATESEITRLKEYASEIQKVTTIGDEQSLGLLTLATNMGVVSAKRDEALRGSIGLAESFASAGLSQETAMKGIALAYQGNFTQLQRYIPALQGAESETDKMAILQKAMADGFVQATDKAKTGAGALEQYGNLVGDLKEKIGDVLKVALVPLVKILGKVVSLFNEHSVLLGTIVVGLGTLGVAIGFLMVKQVAHNALLAISAALSGNWIGLAAAAVIGASAWAVGNQILASSQDGVNASLSESNRLLDLYVKRWEDSSVANLLSEEVRLFRERRILQKQISETTDESQKKELQGYLELNKNEQNYITQKLNNIEASNAEKQEKESSYLEWEKEQNELAKLNEIERLEAEIDSARKKHDAIQVIDQDTLEQKKTLYAEILALESSLGKAKTSPSTITSTGDTSGADAEKAQRLALEKQYSDSASTIAFERAKRLLEIERDASIRRVADSENAEEAIASVRTEYNQKIIALIRERIQAERDVEITKATEIKAEESTLSNIKETYRQKEIEAVRSHNLELAQETRQRYAQERQEKQDLWEFEQMQLSQEDPLKARLNYQLTALDEFFRQKHDSLIKAGFTEEQLVKTKEDAIKKLEEQSYNARVSNNMAALAQMGKNLASTGKVGFEASKAINIAQVAMETPAAAFAAYRSLSGIPLIGPALGAVAFAAAIAQGAMSIKQIAKSKPPKAKYGGLSGLLKGPSHENGGIMINAEGREYITQGDRVDELGVGVFDFINYGPLNSVKKALSTISVPNVPVAPSPSFAYATGGRVQDNGLLGLVVEKLEILTEKIEQKEMSVNNYISANEVINKADPGLLSERSERGLKIRSKF